jgi:hypothetical protein
MDDVSEDIRLQRVPVDQSRCGIQASQGRDRAEDMNDQIVSISAPYLAGCGWTRGEHMSGRFVRLTVGIVALSVVPFAHAATSWAGGTDWTPFLIEGHDEQPKPTREKEPNEGLHKG